VLLAPWDAAASRPTYGSSRWQRLPPQGTLQSLDWEDVSIVRDDLYIDSDAGAPDLGSGDAVEGAAAASELEVLPKPEPTEAEKEELRHELLPRRIGVRTLLAFYTLIYGIVLFIYVFFFRFRDPEKSGCAPLMRALALFFSRRPRLTPLFTNIVLYIGTDLYARIIEIPRVFSIRWTLSVALVCPFFNGFVLVRLYDFADTYLGDQRDFVSVTKRVAVMQVLHLGLYLPASCLLFPLLSEWCFRILVDATETCGTAAILNVHRSFQLAFNASCATWRTAYVNSWQLYFFSNFINFTVVHRWCPEFRSTWDTSVCLLWDMFDTVFHAATGFEGGVCAIGHILLAISPAGVVATPPTLDCATHSFWGLFVGFWVGIYLGIRWFIVNFFSNLKWLAWWIGLHIWRFFYGLWVFLWAVLSIIYDILFVLPGAVWNLVNGKPMVEVPQVTPGPATTAAPAAATVTVAAAAAPSNVTQPPS